MGVSNIKSFLTGLRKWSNKNNKLRLLWNHVCFSDLSCCDRVGHHAVSAWMITHDKFSAVISYKFWTGSRKALASWVISVMKTQRTMCFWNGVQWRQYQTSWDLEPEYRAERSTFLEHMRHRPRVCVCVVHQCLDSWTPAVLHSLIWDACKKLEGLAAFLSSGKLSS